MIEARGLVKRYGATAAVNGLNFTIRPGLVTGFLGPNGAGKTTTMRLILGLDYPSAGTVAVNGRPYAQLPDPMHEVGALLDAGAVPGGRSARSHLLGLAQTNGIARRRVDEVLGLVGLTNEASPGAWPTAWVPCTSGLTCQRRIARVSTPPRTPSWDWPCSASSSSWCSAR
jgi:ABC-2 type transport system ATP-binding protein